MKKASVFKRGCWIQAEVIKRQRLNISTYRTVTG